MNESKTYERGGVTSQVEDLTEKAKQRFEESRSQLKTQVGDAWKDIQDLVRKHPAKAMGITLAAGMMVGMSMGAMRRRESNISRVRGLAGSGVDAWGRVKSGLEEAMNNLKDAFEDALGDLK